jgi:hypothetical protein
MYRRFRFQQASAISKRAVMKMPRFLSSRAAGIAGVAGLFALQSVDEALLCGGGLFGFWQVTLALAVVPLLLLLVSGSRAALVACAVLVPFILFANAAECAPSRGGGAAMGYVPAFLFGVPLAFLAGGVVAVASFLRRRKSADEA